jgi:hypothetical protein
MPFVTTPTNVTVTKNSLSPSGCFGDSLMIRDFGTDELATLLDLVSAEKASCCRIVDKVHRQYLTEIEEKIKNTLFPDEVKNDPEEV